LNRRVQGPTCQRYAGNPSFFHPHAVPVTPIVTTRPQTQKAQKEQKAQLRAQARAWRRARTPGERSEASARVAALATGLPGWASGARIGAYLANDGELDAEPLMRQAVRDGLLVFLPVIRADKQLDFRQWVPDAPLQDNHFGIGEPGSEAAHCPAAALDILCLPVVAFDDRGTRLGMGGGYYDRTLSAARPGCLCGLAFSGQQHEVPAEPWDVPMDYMLSEKGLRAARR